MILCEIRFNDVECAKPGELPGHRAMRKEAASRPACKGKAFGEALEAVKRGKKAARRGWNGKGQYIALGTNVSFMESDGEHKCAMALVFHGTSGIQVGWLASQGDMLGEDWIVLD